MLHRCNVRELEWEGMGKALWESHGNGNWLQNWEWEREGMGIHCTGMGGNGNVKSHSRPSLLYSLLKRGLLDGEATLHRAALTGSIDKSDRCHFTGRHEDSKTLGTVVPASIICTIFLIAVLIL